MKRLGSISLLCCIYMSCMAQDLKRTIIYMPFANKTGYGESVSQKGISELENNLIRCSRGDKRLDNENTRSTGNERVNIFYVAYLCESILLDDIDDDLDSITERSPLNLQK